MFVCRNEMGKSKVEKSTTFDYALIVDAGAKGSTLYIYNLKTDGTVGLLKGRTVEPPLTTLVDTPQKAAQYMKPLFDHAQTVIPKSASTLVFIRASASMRSITPRQQQRVFHAIYRGFRRRISSQFKLKRRNIQTISAAEQGYFHMLATNMLYHNIPVTLDNLLAPPLGAVNIGADSTQIWQPKVSDENGEMGIFPREGQLTMADTYTHSFASYGSAPMLQRSDLYAFRKLKSESEQAGEKLANAPTDVPHPCYFKGHTSKPLHLTNTQIVGMGDAAGCQAIITALLEKAKAEKPCTNPPDPRKLCSLEGVHSPPIEGKFIALPQLFEIASFLKNVVPATVAEGFHSSWPAPSLDQWREATNALCAMPWDQVTSASQSATTADGDLSHRCFDAALAGTLLGTAGLGIASDANDITFAEAVDGEQIHWSMGSFLKELAKDMADLRRQAVIEEVDLVVCRLHRGMFGLLMVSVFIVRYRRPHSFPSSCYRSVCSFCWPALTRS
jgi:hypothetical protein